jgi:two-component system phosphate regulon response regulator PhoB
MLTAKGEEEHRLSGLEAGANDYVLKPFSTRELGLRIKSLLRRVARNQQGAVSETLTFGPLEVDTAAHRVQLLGEEVELTALEFKLLLTFLERKGKVQSRDALLRDVWGYQGDVMTRTVDTNVKRLRQKLERGGDWIETVRGVGYRFSETP